MHMLLARLLQLQVLYIEDFISLLKFFPVFIAALSVVGLGILLVFIWSHKG
jgi:hypothetical protein